MPGASAFEVPLQGIAYAFPTAPGTTWFRQVPTPATSIAAGIGANQMPTGVANCSALEFLTPPTLRTAYSIYSASIAWAALLNSLGAAYTGNILAEVALLINDVVVWIGTDNQPTVPVPSDAGVYYAQGVISADFVNQPRLSPRQRLSLRLGTATSAPVTAHGGNGINIAVGAQIDPLNPSAMTQDQSTISYQILDLPGNRSL